MCLIYNPKPAWDVVRPPQIDTLHKLPLQVSVEEAIPKYPEKYHVYLHA